MEWNYVQLQMSSRKDVERWRPKKFISYVISGNYNAIIQRMLANGGTGLIYFVLLESFNMARLNQNIICKTLQ